MSYKNSFEVILEASCEHCAFKKSVCDPMECKCPYYNMNLMASTLIKNAAENMVNPFQMPKV